MQPSCLRVLGNIFEGTIIERRGHSRRERGIVDFNDGKEYSKVGSSTTDPTYVPVGRVTSSRCFLFRGFEFGVLSARNVRTCCIDDINRASSMEIEH